jgi:Flp pilus assembly protein TadD
VGLDVSDLLEKLVLMAAVLGVGYFLVYRPFLAKRPEPEGTGDGASPLARALALAREGKDPGETLRALEDASREDGHDPEIDAALAFALRASGRKDEARAALARARRGGASDPRLISLEAELCLDTGDVEGAARALESVPDAARGDPHWRLAARIARARGDARAEAAALARMKSRTRDESRALVLPLVERAALAIRDDDASRAIGILKEACALDPTFALAQARLGQALLKAEKWKDARDAFERAVALAKEDAASRLGLAIALEKSGDRRGAARELSEFVTRAKGDPALALEVKRAEEKRRELER